MTSSSDLQTLLQRSLQLKAKLQHSLPPASPAADEPLLLLPSVQRGLEQIEQETQSLLIADQLDPKGYAQAPPYSNLGHSCWPVRVWIG